MERVLIKKSAAEKLDSYFPWIYRNELLEMPAPSRAGILVEVWSKSGFSGIGYFNPASMISVRMLAFSRETINQDFFRRKIQSAIALRKKILEISNACRIIHSEADGLPGLIVDAYNGYLIIQINTAGMEIFREIIIDVLLGTLCPKGMMEKSDSHSRKKEGLGTSETVISGDVPERIEINENGIRFFVEFRGGQKTGFYLDQRRNRLITASKVSQGMDVLDIFCHTGAFGIYAALRGARSVRLIDVSHPVLELAVDNAKLNKIRQIETIHMDAFDFLDKSVREGLKADLIILDPPPFSKTRGSRQGALKGLRHLALQSLRILKPGGFFALFSCSHHVSLDDLQSLCLEASVDSQSKLSVTDFLFQDEDHPYVLNIPQSLYLKGLLFRKE